MLRAAVVGERRLAGPAPVLDPVTRQVVEVAVEEASARARAEGEAAGRAAARTELHRVTASVTAALEGLRAELVSQRDEAVRASLELAAAAAAAVLDRTPPDDATAVLDRVRQATALLDDDVLELHLHPADADALSDAPLDPRLVLRADAGVAPGEARIAGTWGRAELTRAALLGVALDTLAVAPPDEQAWP